MAKKQSIIDFIMKFLGWWAILSAVFIVGILFLLNPHAYPDINKEYIDDYYTCRHFAQDFALAINDTHNVTIISGLSGDEHHAWVEVDGVQYEVTGETRKILWFEDYKEQNRYNIEEWIAKNKYLDNKRDREKNIEMSR